MLACGLQHDRVFDFGRSFFLALSFLKKVPTIYIKNWKRTGSLFGRITNYCDQRSDVAIASTPANNEIASAPLHGLPYIGTKNAPQ
jgi:hypothetical protein